ncbi:MAG: DUF2807 domain-containing protein [Pseudomonadota bacterium]
MKHKTSLLAAFICAGFALKAIAAGEGYDFTGFDKIEVRSGITTEIKVGGAHAIEATSDNGSLRRLVIRKDGDTLEIGRGPAMGLWGVFRKPDYRVTVEVPSLEGITAKSGARVDVANIGAGDFTANAKSGAFLRVSGIEGGEIDATARSGGRMALSGACRLLEADISSGARLNADGLSCIAVDGEARSGADLVAHAKETARGEAASGAQIQISGGPRVLEIEEASGGRVVIN